MGMSTSQWKWLQAKRAQANAQDAIEKDAAVKPADPELKVVLDSWNDIGRADGDCLSMAPNLYISRQLKRQLKAYCAIRHIARKLTRDFSQGLKVWPPDQRGPEVSIAMLARGSFSSPHITLGWPALWAC